MINNSYSVENSLEEDARTTELWSKGRNTDVMCGKSSTEVVSNLDGSRLPLVGSEKHISNVSLFWFFIHCTDTDGTVTLTTLRSTSPLLPRSGLIVFIPCNRSGMTTSGFFFFADRQSWTLPCAAMPYTHGASLIQRRVRTVGRVQAAHCPHTAGVPTLHFPRVSNLPFFCLF